MSKKSRLKEQKIKRQERECLHWKKRKYHEMSEKGILGNKEIEKYFSMFEELKSYYSKHKNEFPIELNGKDPTRAQYLQLKCLYNKIIKETGLEKIV